MVRYSLHENRASKVEVQPLAKPLKEGIFREVLKDPTKENEKKKEAGRRVKG